MYISMNNNTYIRLLYLHMYIQHTHVPIRIMRRTFNTAHHTPHVLHIHYTVYTPCATYKLHSIDLICITLQVNLSTPSLPSPSQLRRSCC